MILLSKDKLKQIIKQNPCKSYTYGLCRGSGELFYVGVGIRQRVFNHTGSHELLYGSNKHKVNIIKNQIKDGNLKYVLFSFNKDRAVCLDVERALIRKFGRSDIQTGSLTNLTDGGEIGANGVVVSEGTRLKLSEKVQERVEVIREQQKEYWKNLTEGEKQQRVSNMRSKASTSEYLASISKAQIKKWSNPEYKERLSKIQAVVQGALADEHRKRTTAYWANPENKEKRLEQNRLRRAAKLNNFDLTKEERVAVPT